MWHARISCIVSFADETDSVLCLSLSLTSSPFSFLTACLESGSGAHLPPALVFCGDLNSDLNDGMPGVGMTDSWWLAVNDGMPSEGTAGSWCLAVGGPLGSPALTLTHYLAHLGSLELLQSGRLSSDHWDWAMGANFKWGMVREVVAQHLFNSLSVSCALVHHAFDVNQEEEDGSEAQQASAPKPPDGKLALKAAAAATASAGPAAAAVVVPLLSTEDDGGWRPSSSSSAPPTNISVVGINIRLPSGSSPAEADSGSPSGSAGPLSSGVTVSWGEAGLRRYDICLL